MASNVRITTELKSPTEQGTFYRLLCMTGPSKGKVYYLTGKRIIIGRGESADIQIVDVKISREHAELSFADHHYVITDLGTQNGIIVNDTKIKQKVLKNGEKIIIGQTVFKYNIIEVKKSSEMIIIAETEARGISKEVSKELLKEVKKGTTKLKAHSKNSDDNFIERKPQSEPKKNPKMLLFIIIIGGVLFVLFDGGNDAAPKRKSASAEVSNFGNNFSEVMTTTSQDDPDTKKKLAAIIHSGRREFREGNYFRAMEDFRLAKLLSPGNRDATYYENKARQRLDEIIKKNFDKGNQEYDSKKYQASIISYCGVIQLIKEYPDDPRYKNAMMKISAVESELGLEKGEVKCFEERSADSRN